MLLPIIQEEMIIQNIDSIPSISIIIPTHNRADCIGETIQSVLDQTYTDWELIVVDAGSTDRTAQVVARFDDKRVIYIYQENCREASISRNVGFAHARGEYVSFLDSDDRMLPHNLETLVNLLNQRPEIGIAYGWYYWINQNGRPNTHRGPKLSGQQATQPWPDILVTPCGTTLEGQILSQLVLEDTILTGTALIRRSCVEAIEGFDAGIQYLEHWDFYLRLARAGYAYACARDAVALICLHSVNQRENKDEVLAERRLILDRLFNDPTLETALSSNMRSQAYYNTYALFAIDYYALGQFKQGTICLNRAMEYAPLSPDDLAKMAELISAQALASEKIPFKFTESLLEEIVSVASARQLRRKVLGRVSAGLAFRHYQSGESHQVWRHVLTAIKHDPAMLRNRGLVRIGLEGAFGSGIVNWIRSHKSPGRNELIEALTNAPILFISPHFDDVVLSCGGTLAHLARRQAEITLVTVFTTDADNQVQLSPLARKIHRAWGGYKNPFEIRCQEDKATAEHLKIKYCWLNFQDVIYRYPTLVDTSEIFLVEFKPKLDPCFEPVCNALRKVIQAYPNAVVFAPLGLGYHRDHLLVHHALEVIKETNPAVKAWYYYEDYPYAATANLKGRLAELDKKLKPINIDIIDTFEERVNLIMMHKSQLSSLFGDPGAVRQAVRDYATRVGTQKKPQERFWSVNPIV
jgi:glycosyltransferase involved in cell wall biosynthesis/LmbE family N-acetylglucosaminyl deacetylase